MISRILLIPLVLATAVACSTNQQSTTIAALESTLTAADDGLLAYFKLPVCGTAGATAICQNPSIKATAQTAAHAAYTTVKAAEASAASGASVDLTAATAAVAALTSIVAALPH